MLSPSPPIRVAMGDGDIRNERGFSLPEVLVVLLLLGVLAAIAIPQFLGQRGSGHDASAKSDVRNLAGAVEACQADSGDYRECDAAADHPRSGLEWGSDPGEVAVVAADRDTYAIRGISRSGREFEWEKGDDSVVTRRCAAEGGGCQDGSW
jgi:type IV pilus assembly protein PilA